MSIKDFRYFVPLILGIIFMGIVGCSSTEKPTAVVSNFLEAMKTVDLEKAKSYTIAGEETKFDFDSPQQEEMVKGIFSHLSFETPVSISEQGDAAVVSVKITSPDLVKVVAAAMKDVMSMALVSAFSEDQNNQENTDKMMEQYLINSISSPDCPLTVMDTKINLKKVDGQWKIEPNDDLSNALTGNIGKAFSQMN